MSQMLEELKCILSFLDVYKFTLHVQKIFWETIQAVPLIFVFGSFANMSYTVQWSKAWLTSALLNVKEFCLNRIVFTSKSGNDKLNPCFFYYFLSFNHVGSEVPSQNVPPTGALCTKLTRVLYLRLKLKFSFLSCLFFFFSAVGNRTQISCACPFSRPIKSQWSIFLLGITADNTCEIRFVIGPLRCLSPDCSS